MSKWTLTAAAVTLIAILGCSGEVTVDDEAIEVPEEAADEDGAADAEDGAEEGAEDEADAPDDEPATDEKPAKEEKPAKDEKPKSEEAPASGDFWAGLGLPVSGGNVQSKTDNKLVVSHSEAPGAVVKAYGAKLMKAGYRRQSFDQATFSAVFAKGNSKVNISLKKAGGATQVTITR